MCGILGSLVHRKDADLIRRVKAGRDSLHHRGPNDQGLLAQDCKGFSIALAHTRLSIIDLSKAGHQPMQSVDKRYTMVFNGEIYNYLELKNELKEMGYHFKTNSDSEVLLVSWQAWGESSLERLRGMFSFVIFDSVDQTLICVRDPFGIKPFFYCFDEKGFHFASELRAIKHLSENKLKLNFQRAYDYLVYGRYDDTEDTFYEGVRQLMPGHLMKVDCSQDSLQPKTFMKRWWWPDIKEVSGISFSEATEELRAMFLSNIRLHMRSDVALGAALSGGIDSSAVVCAMRVLEPDMPIHTFSYVARGTSVDEEKWVDLVNNHVGASENKIFITPSQIMSDLPKVIEAQGEPFLSASIYSQYRVFQCAREKGITVTLDGQGADELLAGYDSYVGARLHSMLSPKKLPEMLGFLMKWRKRNSNPFGFAFAHLVDNFSNSFLDKIFHAFHKSPLPSWIDRSEIKARGIVSGRPRSPLPQPSGKDRRLAEKLRYALTGNGLGALLRHADRNSMCWSIESRVPFLTQDVAQFLLRLPEHYLYSQGAETKSVFRSAMHDLVPSQILSRKDKIGFVCPERQIKERLLADLRKSEPVNLFRMNKINESLNPDQLWRLLNFSTWCTLNEICN